MSEHTVKDYGWTSSAYPLSQQHVHDAVMKILLAGGPCSVLDLGCGNGVLAGRLLAAGCKVIGVDIDSKGVEIAARTYPAGKFLCQEFSVDCYIDPGIQFDAIVASEVIEHLYDPRMLLRCARRNLKTSGILVLTTPYHGWLKNVAISFAGKWDSHHQPGHVGGHIKFWSLSSLRQLLESQGFFIRHWSGTGRFPYLWKSMVITAGLIDSGVGK